MIAYSPMGGDDHRCAWREEVEGLRADVAYATQALEAAEATVTELREQLRLKDETLASVQASVEKLQRHVFGQRSEKMPSVKREIRDPARAEAERIAALRTRREHAEKKRQLVTRTIEHKVREEQKVCPKCGGHDFSRLGGGEKTELYELVPSRVERQVHVQEKLRCRCGETIITADPPAKVYDKARFGPTFMAQIVVSKCADSLPLYRQAKMVSPRRRPGRRLDAGRALPPRRGRHQAVVEPAPATRVGEGDRPG